VTVRTLSPAANDGSKHREVIGALLPGLIGDAQLAVRQAETGAGRRATQAVLAEVNSLTQFFVAYQPDAALLWRVAERGLTDPWSGGQRTSRSRSAARRAIRRNSSFARSLNSLAMRTLKGFRADSESAATAPGVTPLLSLISLGERRRQAR
jgi:hypothetical protein